MLFQFEYLVTVVDSENPPRGGLAWSVDIGMSAFAPLLGANRT
jgi:hypothetical protein